MILGMLFELAPAYGHLRDEAVALADAVRPFAAEADAMGTVHLGVRDALAKSGLAAVVVPRAYGGRDETVDPVAVCVVREVLMGTCSHADSLFALQGIGSFGLSLGACEEQRRRWLPAVARLDVLAALALTEPDAGSDLKRMATTLETRGDGLVIHGDKSFISNAVAAGFFTTLAKEGDGFSLVIVPADAPGVSVTPTPDLIAQHVLGEVHFDHVRLGSESRIGAPRAGFNLVLSTLAVFRVSVAAAAVGLAHAALREAARHASRREQFGRPLARLGPVAQLLADSWTDVEMARLITYRAASLAQQDPLRHLNSSSMAKLAATEAAGRVVDRCVQVMGRFGLVQGSLIEKLYRQARPMRIYEGASEVLRLGIARELCAEMG